MLICAIIAIILAVAVFLTVLLKRDARADRIINANIHQIRNDLRKSLIETNFLVATKLFGDPDAARQVIEILTDAAAYQGGSPSSRLVITGERIIAWHQTGLDRVAQARAIIDEHL